MEKGSCETCKISKFQVELARKDGEVLHTVNVLLGTPRAPLLPEQPPLAAVGFQHLRPVPIGRGDPGSPALSPCPGQGGSRAAAQGRAGSAPAGALRAGERRTTGRTGQQTAKMKRNFQDNVLFPFGR